MNSRTGLGFNGGRRLRHNRRRLWTFEQLEDRTILSAVPGSDLASAIPLGVPSDSRAGAITAEAPVFFQLTPTTDSFLEARVHAVGTLTRLSLLDEQGQNLLVQSDGQSPTNPDDLIGQHLPAGTDYLELQSLGGAGSYTLTTSLTLQSQPDQPLPLGPISGYSRSTIGGDFNGDGRPDLAVANVDSASQTTVQIVLDNSDGTLTPLPSVSIDGGPATSVSLATGDFNGDGRPDLAVTIHGYEGDPATIRILLGNGDGTFGPPIAVPLDGRFDPEPISVAPGDVNGDGRSDLVVTGYDDSLGQYAAEVELSDGDGSFHPEAPVVLAVEPDSVMVGDFNGDGRADLVIVGANFFASIHDMVEVLPGNGDGTFGPATPIDLGFSTQHSFAVVAGDFNGDGHPDLAIASDDLNYGASPTSTLAVLLGSGDGTFREETPVDLATLVGPGSLTTGDFNGDGRSDLAIAEISVQIMLGSSDGTLRPLAPFTPVGADAGGAAVVVAGDFNGDGRVDLATDGLDPALDPAVAVLPGNGDGTFRVQALVPLDITPSAAVTGDFDGDNRTDIAVLGRDGANGQYAAELERGNGDGTFQAQAPTLLGVEPDSVVTGDFNGDGRADLAVEGPGTPSTQPEIEVLLGGGGATFSPQAPFDVIGAGGTTTLVTGDFNGDGRPDLAVIAHFGLDPASTIEVLLGDGIGGFRPQPLIRVALAPVQNLKDSVVVGDFNGDGRADIAFAGSSASVGPFALLVLEGTSNGTLVPQPPMSLTIEPDSVAVGDFTGDGRPDLVIEHKDDVNVQYEAMALVGSGDGTFRAQPPVEGVDSLPQALVGDFTGDGRAGLLVTDPNLSDYDPIAFRVLAGNSDGTLSLQPPSYLGVLQWEESLSPSVNLTGDFNGDGRPDLAVVGQLGIHVGLNLGDGQFVSPSTLADNVHDNPLVAAPGDGTQDVFEVDQTGDILWRQGQPLAPGSFAPPITINPGSPSRDIAFVPASSGSLIASVDLRDDEVTLYRYRAGQFLRVGSLATGAIPAQILAADVNGDGNTDLVVRNAGAGTASIYLGDGAGGFVREGEVPLGAGASDIALADLDGTGRVDLIATSQTTGAVTVFPGVWGAPRVYPAGLGPYGITQDDGDAISSLDATAGVASGVFTRGGAAGLATINPGSHTFSVLPGLGGDALANPATTLVDAPGTIIRAGDFNGDGLSDLAMLESNGVSVYLANSDGQGGFGPPTTYDTGPDPTGLTVADGNGDGTLDLLVGNRSGDVLELVGDGQGHFAPYHNLDGQVALAVASLGSGGADTFAFSNRGLNQVAVQSSAGAAAQVVGDSSQGILDPGAVALADLNGDGIPDLIVANGGGNDILVYPGLGGGEYGPSETFPVGTDPVGITVADVNGDGIPDLVIANHGSNDVSILLGQGQGPGWTLTPLERLKTGAGPTATVVRDVNGDQIPDLFVSDTSAGNAKLLQGVGNGFFNDVNPTTYTTGADPGPLFVDNFTGQPGQLDLVTLNAGSNDLSFVADVNGGNLVAQSIPSGGALPIAAVAGELGGDGGGSDLLVANNEDGHLALFLGGADGLELAQTFEEPGLSNPTALVRDEDGEIFADNEGEESAIAVVLGLGVSPGSAVLSTGPEEQQVVLLQPLSPSSLALIATLLSVPGELAGEPAGQSALAGNASEGQTGGETTTTSQNPSQASIAAAPGGITTASTSEPSEAQASAAATQGGAVTAALPNQALRKDVAGSTGGEPGENEQPGGQAQPQAAPTPTTVSRFIAGVDASLAQARLQARLGPLWGLLTRAAGSESPLRRLGARLARWSLIVELAQAAADHDQGERVSVPAVDDPARTGEVIPSGVDSTAQTARVEVSLCNVIGVSIAIVAAAWFHVPASPVQPTHPRRGYRFGFRRPRRRDPE